MKALLVQPALPLDRKHGRDFIQRWFRPAPVTLPTVAAATPPDVEVEIVDDAFEDIDYDAPVDLVGITGSTPFVPRVNEISRKFRERGVTTVIGGIYGTLYSDLAQPNADAVVVGDAEDTWPRLVEDFRRGELEPRYQSGQPPMTGFRTPRRDLLNRKGYSIPDSFQFQRGCIWSCDFCSIRRQYGREVRSQPIEEVVADVETISDSRAPVAILWDDNLINNLPWAKSLFTALAPYQLRWIGQSTVTIANNPELLRLAAAGGCRGLFLGVESVTQDSLKETHKAMNRVDRFKEQIQKIHDQGIAVQAGMVFGFDHDDRSCFERTVEFACQVNIDSIAFSILTPYPGMALHRELDEQGRIFDRDLGNYDSNHVVFHPKLMSAEELQDGYHWAMREFFGFRSIARRARGMASRHLSIPTNLAYYWASRWKFPVGKNPAGNDEQACPSHEALAS